jgi:hypothetical protein
VFEKVYFPAVYLAPKRYAGRYWSKPDKPDQVKKDGKDVDRIDTKGAESVRRDNCKIVSEAVDTTLRKMLAEDDLVGAVLNVAGLIDDLRMGRADISKLVVSKSLSKNPENYAPRPIHAQLALKMRQRDPATAPRVGDRVPYLIVAPEVEKNAKVSECGEDPKFVLDHDVPLFVNKYLDMLRAPVERILEPVVPGVTRLLFEGDFKRPTMQPSIQAVFARGKGVTDVLSEYVDDPSEAKKKKKKVRERSDHEPSNRTLEWARERSKTLIGDIQRHVEDFLRSRKRKPDASTTSNKRRQVEKISSASPMLRLGAVRIVPQCFRCQQPVPENRPRLEPCSKCAPGMCDCEEHVGAPAFCDSCRAKHAADLLHHRAEARDEFLIAKKENDERWEICRKCVGSIEDSETCGYRECGYRPSLLSMFSLLLTILILAATGLLARVRARRWRLLGRRWIVSITKLKVWIIRSSPRNHERHHNVMT